MEADWDAEMSIFKKRIMKPSQLATMRQIEGEASIGKVIYIEQDLAIVEGLNNDADLGTVVSFASGARGYDPCWLLIACSALTAMLTDDCFASHAEACVITFQSALVETQRQHLLHHLLWRVIWNHNGYACSVQHRGRPSGWKQMAAVLDDEEGAVTKRKYEIARLPVDGLKGKIVNYFGSVKGGQMLKNFGKQVPLLNKSPDMEDREQINQALFTGVAAVDTLAPLGRGQSILLAGLKGSGKRDLMLEAIIGQKKSGVRCVLGLIEGVRDDGGHALVMISSLAPMVKLWDLFTNALMDMGPKARAE
eukprot:scaffold36333_cov46-Prasinocladus_malaysianus.AAC.3